MRADIRLGRVSAFHSKSVIGLEWVLMTATDPKATFSKLTNSMKFAQEFRSSIDARVAKIAITTSLGGFALLHWNGLRLAGKSKYDGAFAKPHYDLGFSQAVWAVFSVVILVILLNRFSTRITIRLTLKSEVSRLRDTIAAAESRRPV